MGILPDRVVPAVVVILLLFCFRVSLVDGDISGDEKQALLDFVGNLPHTRVLNWSEDSTVCGNWAGVACDEGASAVVAVRLPGVGFHGPIPPNTLGRLSGLRILSLRLNAITGVFPPDLLRLRNLSGLYLQKNNFSGPLPMDFSGWSNLTVLNLSGNGFNGSIPASISKLKLLVGLNLASNRLSGEIPNLELPQLQFLNLSNNSLSGEVPRSLRRFPSSAFLGNNVSFPTILPGGSPVVAPPGESHQRPERCQKLSETAVLGIVAACCIVAVVAFTFLIFMLRARRKQDYEFTGPSGKVKMSPERTSSRGEDANRMVFFEGCNHSFDLEDLLRASAEVLGKGTFGISYKAILEDAATVVVKRLKEVGVGRRDFEQQMQIVGGIKHENVVELKAYFYSKDEKLMVYDYHPCGSLASLLHGNRGEAKGPLDWESRKRIVLGAARGISRIHSENGKRLVHGNIKSSNVLLNDRGYGCVADVGLASVMHSLSPSISRTAGYRAPEVSDTRKAGQPSDVYSFGVVLLEMLTGKFPVHSAGCGEMVHLVRWVHSVVREEWTAEVFDMELMRYPNIEEELVEMLQIAMSCVVRTPDQRPRIVDIVTMIENVRRRDSDGHESCRSKQEGGGGVLSA
ncbi:hypothetical protein MLD38_018509 [Melastoma candidum]|uniref:Uncharacterized protein n=1 Tax=Melastoma candidum TaxID=119954 RepID=A0ACB9QY35_9MYRT|nr:hypothetical protein MLD38_018509 [Melastoma candidum]